MNNIKHFFTNKDDGNIAYHVKDIIENVDYNREQLALKYQFKLSSLKYMNQVHGKNIEIVTKTSPQLIDNCDALITAEKDLALMVMVADCIPILIQDKVQGVIAAVHAGRNSTFQNIVGLTLEKMMKHFNSKKENIEVILGPSIQKCCYEVSKDLAQIVNSSFGNTFVNERMIDLQGINKQQIESLGVKNITISNVCTKCSNEPYFSYRQNKNCGRFCGIIINRSIM